MKIISLNAWGGAMYESLREWLPHCKADILCLQEVTCTAGLSGWTRFDDGERDLPQRANLFADVSEALPFHQGIFLTSDSGPVYDSNGDQHQQDFGIAMFVHERYPIVCTKSAFVHGEYKDHIAWTIQDRPRIAHTARLVDRTLNKAITIAHLHGLRDPNGKDDSPERSVQAENLAKLITNTRSPEDLVVACGDLNLLPSSDTFRVLKQNCSLTDLVGTSDTRTSKYTKPVRHANYMLVSDISAVLHFAAPAEPEVSDHRFLSLDI